MKLQAMIRNGTKLIGLIILVMTVLHFSPFVMYRIITPSMQPTIKINDVVIISRWIDTDSIEVGDIIAFHTTLLNQDDVIVVHYVHEITEENNTLTFKTIAEGQSEPDRWVINEDDVVGIYTSKISGIGRILEFFGSLIGQIVLILNIGIIVAWIYVDDKSTKAKHEKK